MKAPALSQQDRAFIEDLVLHAKSSEKVFETLLHNLFNTFSSDDELMKYVHSMKWRIKNADHLRDKLIRKWHEASARGKEFTINKNNLFVKVNDLAGFRILHLYTRQFQRIDACLQRIFAEQMYRVVEGPSARTWDDESREYFRSINTRFVKSSTLYTSVHYVVAPNQRTKYTCEIQVRTLAEELWGEVDHTLNYPHVSKSLSCREQIKVLARVTSSCTRLVDSIFLSHNEHKATEPKKPRRKARA
ncbi:MAG: RelA/SpoT domain-containing protein [Bryobacteraceae bacterium]|jgi:ppGpp synthetase/RelA/SpoT-type nucleotidyltranferase